VRQPTKVRRRSMYANKQHSRKICGCVCVCVLCEAAGRTARVQQVYQQKAMISRASTWLCVCVCACVCVCVCCAVQGNRPNCAGAANMPTSSIQGKYVVVCVCCVGQPAELRGRSNFTNRKR